MHFTQVRIQVEFEKLAEYMHNLFDAWEIKNDKSTFRLFTWHPRIIGMFYSASSMITLLIIIIY